VLAVAFVSNGVTGASKAGMAAITHLNLANSLRLAGDLERAAEHYRRALALDPSLDVAARNLASMQRALASKARRAGPAPAP
jgi:tetratricopeptide (TPR) repeat protein